jgi:20S proteasome alpha/beta subunit
VVKSHVAYVGTSAAANPVPVENMLKKILNSVVGNRCNDGVVPAGDRRLRIAPVCGGACQ